MKTALVILMTLLVAAPALAAPCTWVEGSGSVVADRFSPAEARSIALKQARHDAIAKVTGVRVTGATLVRDSMLVGDFVKSLSRGFVREEKIVKWDQDKYQPTPQDFPIPVITVQLRACVAEPPAPADTGFSVTATLDKTTYGVGDKARLLVTASRDAYLYIFNLAADDRVTWYGRYPFISPIPIAADATITFPPPGVALRMALPKDFAHASEAFIVVAAKEKVNLENRFGGRTELSLTEFYYAILAIPGDFVEDVAVYTVGK